MLDRDAELADLARFCTAQDVEHPYLWVRVSTWSGKSALLSGFVSHPPKAVRVVSFFVTARHGDQDHQGAFLLNVMEQLAELLAQPLPPAQRPRWGPRT